MVSTEGNKVQRTIMRLFFISPLKLLYYKVLYLTYWYKCVSSKCVKRLANYWIIWLLLFHAKILHCLYYIVHAPNRMWLRNSGFYVSAHYRVCATMRGAHICAFQWKTDDHILSGWFFFILLLFSGKSLWNI